jgi:predicted nucleic acid-binding protein
VSSFGVVLDACVLIPASIRDTLLRAAQKGMYRLHWSNLILEEVGRNLVNKRMTTEEGALYLFEQMQEAFPQARVHGFESLIPSMTNDEKDRHVLAVAVVSKSQVIVTSNIRDFPEAALNPFGIEAQTPDQFLTHLFYLNPQGMVELLTQQARDLENPPMSLPELLEELALHAPGFINLISPLCPQ